MREYSFFIEQPFVKGLRPEDTYLNREGFLEACFNMVPDEGGLKLYEAATDPFQGGVAVDFPHPQVFVGRDIVLSAGTTSVKEVNTNVSPWTLSNITTKDPDAPSSNKSIPTGGPWHFADLGPSWYLANGNCVVFRTGLDRLEGSATTTTYVQDSVTVKSVAEHKGRVYVGGFDKDNIWNSHWQTLFAEWEANADLSEIDLVKSGPGSNWVMWSSIGGGDFPLWLFMPAGYGQLGQGPSADTVLKRIKRNEFGWMPMRWPGTVQALKPLGDNLIVYGDNGITALVPQGSLIGKREIARFGILGRGAVGGDEQGHFFIDQDGVAWSLGGDLQLVRLGYEEWFGSFPGSSTIVSHKPAPEDLRTYHICSPDQGYIFNANGLAEHKDRITSIPYLEGIFYAVHTSAASSDIRIQTTAWDQRRQGLKTIHDIQVQYSDITDVQVSILYRYNHTENFRTWGPVKVNEEGVVTSGVTGLEFKIKVTGTPGTNPRLDGLEVRWNLVDYRAVRGLTGEAQQAGE